MSDTTRKPVKCGNCGWTGYDGDEGMDALAHCKALGERLDPGSVVPAGECEQCGAFVYYQKNEIDEWRDLANAAVDILEQLQEGAHDFLWSEVAEIINDRDLLSKS